MGSGDVGGEYPPEGWYRDPWGLAEVRWWDGRQWTAAMRGPAGSPPPAGRRRRGLFAILAVVGVAALIATVMAFLFLSRELVAGIFDIAWAPDGQHLAYTTDSGLWVVPADGSEGPRRLREGSAGWVQWAPDSRSIAFAVGASNELAGQSLWVVDLATGSTRELADLYPYRSLYAWAPDASALAIVGPLGDVSVVDAATGRSRVLMSTAGGAGQILGPVWNGDASAVILAGARRGGGEGIWAITAQNGEQDLLWSGPVSDLSSWLSVEPGVRGLIAFERCTETGLDDPGHASQDVCTWYAMQQDGSGLRRLDQAPQWADADTGVSQPWLPSPDGRHVARVEGTGTGSELWVDSADGASHVMVAER